MNDIKTERLCTAMCLGLLSILLCGPTTMAAEEDEKAFLRYPDDWYATHQLARELSQIDRSEYDLHRASDLTGHRPVVLPQADLVVTENDYFDWPIATLVDDTIIMVPIQVCIALSFIARAGSAEDEVSADINNERASGPKPVCEEVTVWKNKEENAGRIMSMALFSPRMGPCSPLQKDVFGPWTTSPITWWSSVAWMVDGPGPATSTSSALTDLSGKRTVSRAKARRGRIPDPWSIRRPGGCSSSTP